MPAGRGSLDDIVRIFMEANTKHDVKITITLTAQEALWLKAFVQNPKGHPFDEPAEEAEMRQVLFSALPAFEELYSANTTMSGTLLAFL